MIDKFYKWGIDSTLSIMSSGRELSASQLISSGEINNADLTNNPYNFFFGTSNTHLAALAALLNIVALGMVSAFSAQATVDMRHPGSRFMTITNNEVTWIASLPGIGAIFGNLFAGKILELWYIFF